MIDMIYSLIAYVYVCESGQKKKLMKGQFMDWGISWALKVRIELHMGVLYMVVH